MIHIFVLLLAFVMSFCFTVKVREVLVRRNVLDTPNERSSHTVPVPRGGGWALLGVLFPGILIAAFLEGDYKAPVLLAAGVALLALISWHDDKKGVSARVRLLLHLLAATLGSLALGHGAVLFGGFLPFWLDRLILITGWAWFINLYNFMDGIDGITSTETIALAGGSFLVMTAANLTSPFPETLTYLLAGSCLGFLALNWHPARLFMGDVGSVPLGFLTGFLLLNLAAHGYLIAGLVLPLYYIADSGITITRRALRGEKIWQPHRQHFYQKAALRVGRHDRVVAWIGLANIALIGSALLSVTSPLFGLCLGLLVTALLLIKMGKS